MVSSTTTHGPKVKSAKNQPKSQQYHQHKIQEASADNASSSANNITSKQEVAPLAESIGDLKLKDSTEEQKSVLTENVGSDDDANLAELSSEPRKRNKRGGHGIRHDIHH